MKNLFFDFQVNKETNTVSVTREFNAELPLVWMAWTTPEILEQWWAPKPYKAITKSMDFREGGTWLYYMLSPEGDKHWCKNDYITINMHKSYKGLDAFCDENGVINENFPRTTWTNTFTEENGTTKVNIHAQYDSLKDLEMIIEMGFKEGFTMALENLDFYLESQFKLRKENKTSKEARVSSYVNFDGNTEEAMMFYQKVFKTEFINGIKRFEDIPAGENQPPMAESIKKMVLHVELPLIGGHILMATDAPKEMGFTLNRGNNMHFNLEPDTLEEAQRLFDELSVNGNIEMNFQPMFWGGHYGGFTDQFGINWMINYQD